MSKQNEKENILAAITKCKQQQKKKKGNQYTIIKVFSATTTIINMIQTYF
jgi:hypothetical protein